MKFLEIIILSKSLKMIPKLSRFSNIRFPGNLWLQVLCFIIQRIQLRIQSVWYPYKWLIVWVIIINTNLYLFFELLHHFLNLFSWKLIIQLSINVLLNNSKSCFYFLTRWYLSELLFNLFIFIVYYVYAFRISFTC